MLAKESPDTSTLKDCYSLSEIILNHTNKPLHTL